MRCNKSQCELFYIANYATIILLTLWDLLEASTSGTLCASTFGTSTIWGYKNSPMYNNEFQWLLKDKFHIIYHIVATIVVQKARGTWPGPWPGKTARRLARPGPALTGHGRHGPATGPEHGPRTRPVARCQSGSWKGTARWRPDLPMAQSAIYSDRGRPGAAEP
jgi:hypothetical protein